MRSWWLGLWIATGALVAVACGDDEAAAPTPIPLPVGPGGSGGDGGSGATGGAGGTGGGVTDLSQPWNSGSRLRAYVLDPEDGDAIRTSFIDTELDRPCGFRRHADDGGYRCMPFDAYIGDVFADANCTVPLARKSRSVCRSPMYAVASDRFACIESLYGQGETYESASRVYEVGAAVQPTTIYNGSNCTPSTPQDTLEYFEVSAEVPASRFVSGSEEFVEVNGAIEQKVIAGEDGSSMWWYPWDRVRHTRCNFSGLQRCLPPFLAATYGSDFTDDTCQAPAVLSTTCSPPDLAINLEDDTLWEVGAAVDGATAGHFNEGDQQCELWTVSNGDHTDYDFFTQGASVSEDDYVAFEAGELGTGRLRAGTWDLTTGETVRLATSWRDTDADALCTPLALDGTMRCAITGGMVGSALPNLYADAGCTEPVARVSSSATSATEVFLRYEEPACAADPHGSTHRTELRSVTSHTGPIYEMDGTCQLAVDAPLYNYVRVGAMVDVSAAVPTMTFRVE